MGSGHGKKSKPVELQGVPEAWGKGKNKKEVSEMTTSPSPAMEKVMALGAEDIKIESMEEDRTNEKTSPEMKENESASDTSQASHVSSANTIKILNGNKTPAEPVADVSITSRRPMRTRSGSPRPKSDGSTRSWNAGSLDAAEGSSHMSVTSYNLTRTIRSSCRSSKCLLDYSDMMFKEILKKLELMHTNTRLRFSNDFERVEQRNKQQFTDITHELKELKQAVEKQNKLLGIQQQNEQPFNNKFSPPLPSESALQRDESREWSRATTKLVCRASSQYAPAPITKPSRLPVPVRVESRTVDGTKSETVGYYRDPPEQQSLQQQREEAARRIWNRAFLKQQHRESARAMKTQQRKQPNKANEKQINIQEHKKGPKLARFRF